jgi:DNA-binding NarL/FixJ family response regulator
MIRVCVVDDHPALRTGLWTVIQNEPGMQFAGSVSRPDEGLALAQRVHPDVVLVDYQLPREDGIVLCQRLKALPDAAKVLVYSAYSDPALAILAIVAGADGILSKAALADELLDTIRLVVRGRTVMPPIPTGLLEASAAKLDPSDVAIFYMIMNGIPLSEVAEVVGIEMRELGTRLRTMLGRLRVETKIKL